LYNVQMAGFSLDNVAFGQGGALLQQINRDTLKFAMKCSAIRVNGEWRDVFKDPITDKGKVSKKGQVTLYTNAKGEFLSEQEGYIDSQGNWSWSEALVTVFENGKVLNETNFDEIRARANKPFEV